MTNDSTVRSLFLGMERSIAKRGISRIDLFDMERSIASNSIYSSPGSSICNVYCNATFNFDK
ncbi:hypothetical protein [Microcoleus sp. AT9b-C5]|uniref:hypothetical protein n=1 Tax=Microcoleus sp. AT9b-C5 TaxID=2818631 RepID=UPI002FD5A033